MTWHQKVKRGALALVAVCFVFFAAPSWAEDKPADTKPPAPATPPPDPHTLPDPVGAATTGTDLGSDLSGAKGASLPIVDLPDREKDGTIKVEKDKDGKPVLDKDGKPKTVMMKDDKGQPVKGLVVDVSPDEMKSQVNKVRNGLNMLWTCLAGFLVFFMQAGFALVETGFCRAKNAAHTMGMNMMVFCIGFIGYYVCGYAFMFGGVGKLDTLGGTQILNKYLIEFGGAGAGDTALTAPWHILGGKGFLWSGLFDAQVMAHFMFQMVFMDTAATIPTGSMAERIKWGAFIWMSFFLTMFTYPLIGCWVWGGGWLSQIGAKWSGLTPDAAGALLGNAAMGNGAICFSGSGVIHMVGGFTALMGAWVLGPRIGKYDKNGNARAIPGHDMPMAILGTIILFFGWFGFNPGSTLSAGDYGLPVAAVNTMIAGAFGGFSTMLYMMYVHPSRKPDPGMCCNGILAGLVAITSPCVYVSPTASVLIGLVAGVIVVIAVGFVENKLKIDDPVGAFSVHGVNGFFGVLCVGLFACGTYGAGTNGVTVQLPNAAADHALTSYGVLGMLPIGAPEGTPWFYMGQMKAQIVFAVVDALTVMAIELTFFKVYNALFGLRSKPEDEMAGLDIPEAGCPGYPNWPIHDTPGLYSDLAEGATGMVTAPAKVVNA